MKLFKKKGPEIIDLTELSKKGILQRSRAIANQESTFSTNEDKVLDLTSRPSSSPSPSVSQSASDSPFSLLSSLASAATTESSAPVISSLQSSDFQSLKIKVEDLEYKLDRFMEKILKIEEKLSSISQD